MANKANEQRCHESTKRATALATKALAKDEYDEDNDYVAQQIEVYATPFFARVDAVMAKIQAMDDGFGNWAVFGDELLVEEDDKASAPTMPPLAPLTAMLSPHHHPKSYVDAVLTTIGGSSQATSLPLGRRLYHCLPLTANSGRYANAPNLVVMLVAAMAPELPIHRSTFFAGGNISPVLPTNLL